MLIISNKNNAFVDRRLKCIRFEYIYQNIVQAYEIIDKLPPCGAFARLVLRARDPRF